MIALSRCWMSDRRRLSLWAVLEQDRIQHFIGPVWLKERQGSHHKAGSRKMDKLNIKAAGIDTGKARLDVAVCGSDACRSFSNDEDGHDALMDWLVQAGVDRVGI